MQAANQLPPAVIIPGLAGSLLDATVHRESAVNPLCKLEGEDNLWFNKKFLVPGLMDCWVEEMSLNLDINASRKFGLEKDIEPDGVHVHVGEIGDDFEKVFFNYGAWHGGTGIWSPLFDQLRMLGYDAKHDMHAAPFDWRRGPAYWKYHDWPQLKKYVEEVVEKAGGKRVILFSISQGGPYVAGFLIHFVNAAWKQKHIEGFISYSGVFGGTPASLALALWGKVDALQMTKDLGYQARVDFLGEKNVKSLLRGFGGAYMLMPMQVAVGDVTLIQLPPTFHANLTINDLQAVLPQVSPQMGMHYKMAQEYPLVDHPGVKTFCFYGTGLHSPASYTYLATPTNASASGDTNIGKVSHLVDAAKTLGKGGTPNVMSLMKDVSDLSHSLSEELVGAEDDSSAPAALPADTKPGSAGWARAVGELIAKRQPDILHTTLGDGLVPDAGLAVCQNWRGQVGVPDVEVHTISRGKHGSELFNSEALLATRATVAKWAGVENPSAENTPVAKGMSTPSGEKDLPEPLAEFAQFLPPQVAKMTCPQWVASIENRVPQFKASGCNADVCNSSPTCPDRLKMALGRDPQFVHSRCPETCHASTSGAHHPTEKPPTTTLHTNTLPPENDFDKVKPAPFPKKDMEMPLAAFASTLPESSQFVASWNCQQWTQSISHAIHKDIRQIACSGTVILQSPNCDIGLRAILSRKQDFVASRCPETCKSGRPPKPGLAKKAPRTGELDGPGSRRQQQARPQKTTTAPSEVLTDAGPGQLQHLRKAGTSASPKEKQSSDSEGMSNTFLQIYVLMAGLFLFCVVLAFGVLCFFIGMAKGQGKRRVALEADIPLRDDGDFSEFEDSVVDSAISSSWVASLLNQQRLAIEPPVSESTPQAEHPSEADAFSL